MKLSQIFSFGLCGALLLGTAACSSSDEPGKGTTKPEYKTIQLSRAEQDFVETQNNFAVKFYQEIRKNEIEKNPNLAISPMSASMVMSIVATGANGNTRDEIIETLGFADADIDAVNCFNARLSEELRKVDPSTAFNLANAAWFDKSITVKDAFLKNCRDAYGMTAENVELATEKTRQAINKWALDNTNGLIENFIKSVEELNGGKAFIANALYFKGIWEEPFDKDKTLKGPFHNVDGTKSRVDLMHNSPKTMVAVEDSYSAVILPLGSGNYDMVFVLPSEGKDFGDVLVELESKDLTKLCDFSATPKITLPRFEIVNDDIMLKEVLYNLGIKDAFDIINADFSCMSDNPSYINGVKQSTHIIVNEEGAEAAAVTGTGWLGAPGPGWSEEITFDRPFGFYIFESSTGAILFIGEVNKL